MYCRKCKQPLDLTKPGLTCSNCGYNNTTNPENLPNVTGETVINNNPDFKDQMTCPNCGSRNVIIDPNVQVQNTPFSPANAAMGCCCCGFPGLLCGLTGGKKIAANPEKVCNDCGTHFK